MKHNTHYDAIPPQHLIGTILDVGCGDGSNQAKSRNYMALASNRYTGIDIEEDIFKYQPDTQFDTVLAIHVIEHIPLSRWPLMFRILKTWVKPGGRLIIGVPYMQSPDVYKNYKGPENQRHVVFGIDETTINQYFGILDTVLYFRYRGPYSQSLMCIWRKEQ